jgi:AraC-like DNA-binding protein
MNPVDRHVVHAWTAEGVFFERYRYAPGRAEALAPHSHDSYQLCFSADFPGQYRYRRRTEEVPVGSVSVLLPGEVHSARDPVDRPAGATFLMMYVEPDQLAGLARDLVRGEPDVVSFRTAILLDPEIASLFMRVHDAARSPAPSLLRDGLLTGLLTELVLRYGEGARPASPAAASRSALGRAAEYLAEHCDRTVRLAELADVAGLSPFHLLRSFRELTGLTPHRYQMQHRIERAKKLLLQGRAGAEVAARTGFTDQSHFIAQFRRLVGVTPGRYRPRPQ